MRTWLKYECPLALIESFPADFPGLLDLIFTLSPDLCIPQAKCIRQIVLATSGDSADDLSLAEVQQEIVRRVCALSSLYGSRCDARYSLPRIVETRDLPMLKALSKAVGTLCSSHIGSMMQDEGSFLHQMMRDLLFYLPLDCDAVSQPVFRYWKKFAKTLASDRKLYLQFQPSMVAALQICIGKMILPHIAPEDSDGTRTMISRILGYVGKYLRASTYWPIICDQLRGSLSSPEPDVDRLEAILYSLADLLSRIECASDNGLHSFRKSRRGHQYRA